MPTLISTNTPPSSLPRGMPLVPSSAPIVNVSNARGTPQYSPAVTFVSQNIPKYMYPYHGTTKDQFYAQNYYQPPTRPADSPIVSQSPQAPSKPSPFDGVVNFVKSNPLLVLGGLAAVGIGAYLYFTHKSDDELTEMHSRGL